MMEDRFVFFSPEKNCVVTKFAAAILIVQDPAMGITVAIEVFVRGSQDQN